MMVNSLNGSRSLFKINSFISLHRTHSEIWLIIVFLSPVIDSGPGVPEVIECVVHEYSKRAVH
jgi:hypothetical protein